MGEDKLDEEILPDSTGKFPETVPWNKYVGIKESLGKKLDTEKQKVASLEEQLKKAVSPEEFTKTKEELDQIKSDHQKVADELKSLKDKSVSEKREVLKTRGVPEDKIKDVSEKELDILISVLGDIKPKPGSDLGGGGGSGSLPNDPMELFRMAKTRTK